MLDKFYLHIYNDTQLWNKFRGITILHVESAPYSGIVRIKHHLNFILHYLGESKNMKFSLQHFTYYSTHQILLSLKTLKWLSVLRK